MKLLKILSTGRVMLLLSFILMSFIAISPDPWASGLEIKGIDDNSSAKLNGLSIGDIIKSVGGEKIETFDDLFIELDSYSIGEIVNLETDSGSIAFVKEVKYSSIISLASNCATRAAVNSFFVSRLSRSDK